MDNKACEINFLTPENCTFVNDAHGFLKAAIDGEDKGRVYLYRAFPHDMTDKFIVVCDEEKNEYGMIRDLSLFPDMQDELKKDLDRRYFIPKILEISSLEETFGNSLWHIKTDIGERVIKVLDTFRNIIRIGEDRAIVLDEDGNRYEIVSLAGLDKKSFRRIELFL